MKSPFKPTYWHSTQVLKPLEPESKAEFLSALGSWLVDQPAEEMSDNSSLLGNLVLFTVIILFLTRGWIKQNNIYEDFVEGAKQGFDVAIKLIPYLLAMLVAIGLL